MEFNDGIRWPAVALQGIILSNITLIGISRNESFNVFLLISAIIILSLFILQSVSRRFLLLYPYNQFMNVETPSIDTYILKIFLITSIFFFLIGLLDLKICNIIFSNVDRTLLCCILLFFIISVVLIFLIFIPIIWLFCLRKKSIKKVVDLLKNTKFEQTIPCPKCCGGKAKRIRKVLDRKSGMVITQCEKCGYKREEDVKFIIAYGT